MPNDESSRFWSAEVLVGVGFLMLLLTSLEGWGMVGVIAFGGPDRTELLHELKRLHNLGLAGSFLAICSGLALLVLPLQLSRSTTICRVLLPSLLIAPLAFCEMRTRVAWKWVIFILSCLSSTRTVCLSKGPLSAICSHLITATSSTSRTALKKN